jgi:hypothetical protein
VEDAKRLRREGKDRWVDEKTFKLSLDEQRKRKKKKEKKEKDKRFW